MGIGDQMSNKIEGKVRSSSFELQSIDEKPEASLIERPGSGHRIKQTSEKQNFERIWKANRWLIFLRVYIDQI